MKQDDQLFGADKVLDVASCKPTCLLIMQKSFHAFHHLLVAELECKGYEVQVANFEYPEHMVGRLMGKLQFPLVYWYTERVITQALLHRRYDIAIIINGRGINRSLAKKIKQHSGKLIAFLWDSVAFCPWVHQWMDLPERFYTIDYKDAEAYKLGVVELFSYITPINTEKKLYDLTLIGRNAPERLKYLHQLIQSVQPKKTFIYLTETSLLMAVCHFIAAPVWSIRYRNYIHLKALPNSRYEAVLRSSRIVADMAPKGQSGITMRCYEAVAAGARLITNNPFLHKSRYFDAGNSLVIGEKTNVETIRKFLDCPMVPTIQYRKVADFVSDLLRGSEPAGEYCRKAHFV